MKKTFILLALIMLIVVGLRAQTPLNNAVDFTATDADGVSHNLFSYLDDNKYVVIMFTMPGWASCTSTYPVVEDSYTHFGCNSGNVVIIAVSTAHTATQLQALGFSYPMIPGSPSGNSINGTYSIGAYPTVILIAPNKSIVEKDIWPISNSILRDKITNAGGVAQACPQTSIDEPETSMFSIFPNPVEDMIYITSDCNATVDIFDVTGKKVESFQVDSQAALNTSHLQTGMYLIRAFNQEGQVIAVEKILKQ